jgi:prepilin signal peptidase PulO-like enzyme (type II secretory pathway)
MTFLLYIAIFVLGALLGGQLNRGIYRLAWKRRPIGPWSTPDPEAPPRRATDRLPIVGWLGLRREAAIHGPLYWVRPMLIEAATGLGAAALYWWEVDRAALMPRAALPPFDAVMLHLQYASHVVLFSLMLVATFIDFDEKTIPDAITIPGALVGLLLMGAFPVAAPPVAERLGLVGHLHLASPRAWPAELNGWQGLVIGLCCFVGWCLAVWPRTVTMRRGLTKAIQYAVVSMFRFSLWWAFPLILLAGSAGVVGVWARVGTHWSSLLTSLVGMAFGGGLIWAVRVVGGGALGKEAMGFGDVTLMAMIGAFLGWQASLMIFFLAPFVAVVICLAQWILTRRRDIAFGPYLCVAAVIVVLYWSPIWELNAKRVFELGWLIPQIVGLCLILLACLLGLWRLVERLVFGVPSESPE